MSGARYPDVFAAILVGGHGRRLGGTDKARLPATGAQTLLKRLVRLFRPAVSDVLLAGRPDQDFPETGCRLVSDRRPECGPLGGLEAVLEVAPEPWCFLLACDMPAIDTTFLDTLARGCTDGARIVIAETGHGLEPTCALYHRDLLDRVRAALDAGRCAPRVLFDEPGLVTIRLAPEMEAMLANINEPSDLQK